MKRHITTFTFLLGILVGVACSDDMKAAADGAVEAIISAADIEYDNASSGLVAEDVQSALDELVTRTAANTSAADGAQKSADGLEQRVTALESVEPPAATAATIGFNDALAKLDAVTVQVAIERLAHADDDFEEAMAVLSAKGAVELSLAPIEGVEGDNVQAALASLALQVQEQSAALADATQKLAQVSTCPPDTVLAVDTCVESGSRPPQLWSNASKTCKGDERRLCTVQELKHACSESVYQAEQEWTADLADTHVAITTQYVLNECVLQPTEKAGINIDDARAFRCCEHVARISD